MAAATRRLPDTGPRPATDDPIPLLEPLRGLLPDGLRRGDAAELDSPQRSPDALSLALLAGALAAGLWCAAIATPDLGIAALADMLGAERRDALDRLITVPEPGERWPEAVTGLADGVDLVLIRPPAAVPADMARRVDARLRQGRSTGTRHAAALLVLGSWPTARLTLSIARRQCTGLDGVGPTAGTGQFTGATVLVTARGRATAGRPRTARLLLPAPDGAARDLIETPATAQPARRLSSVA